MTTIPKTLAQALTLVPDDGWNLCLHIADDPSLQHAWLSISVEYQRLLWGAEYDFREGSYIIKGKPYRNGADRWAGIAAELVHAVGAYRLSAIIKCSGVQVDGWSQSPRLLADCLAEIEVALRMIAPAHLADDR